MNILERLEASANYIERNAGFCLEEDQDHYSYNKKIDAVNAMREAAKLMRDCGFGERPFARELPHIPV